MAISEGEGHFTGEPTRKRGMVKTTEQQKEQGWQLEVDKHFLEVVHIDESGRKYITTDTEVVPTASATNFSETLLMGDVKLEITPYQMQIFGKDVDIVDGNRHFSKFSVGIVDKSRVAFISVDVSHKNGYRATQQYFFDKKGRPDGFQSAIYSGPSWPATNPKLFENSMLHHFLKLKDSIGEVAQRSLQKSLAKLS